MDDDSRGARISLPRLGKVGPGKEPPVGAPRGCPALEALTAGEVGGVGRRDGRGVVAPRVAVWHRLVGREDGSGRGGIVRCAVSRALTAKTRMAEKDSICYLSQWQQPYSVLVTVDAGTCMRACVYNALSAA